MEISGVLISGIFIAGVGWLCKVLLLQKTRKDRYQRNKERRRNGTQK